MNTGKANPRIGLFLGETELDRANSLAFVALSLIREWSRLFPGQFTVFYRSSHEEFMRTVGGLEKFAHRALGRHEELCWYRNEVDVLYTPCWWSEIAIDGLPQVHFIPDLAPVLFPSHVRKVFRDGFLHACRKGAGISKCIIAPSEYSKRTLIDQLGLPEERTRVVHNGVHQVFSDDSDGGTRPRNLPQNATNYLYFPASPLKRKNHLGLLDALVHLRDRYALEPYCIFTGDFISGFHAVDIEKEILRRGLSNRVQHIGTVSLSELKYLYVMQRCWFFPAYSRASAYPYWKQ